MNGSRLARLVLALGCVSVASPAVHAANIGGAVACQGSASVLFSNTTAQDQNLILLLQANVQAGGVLNPVTLTWHPPEGGAKSAVMGTQASEAFAIAVRAGTNVVFSCAPQETLTWQAVKESAGGNFDCGQAPFGTSGILFNDALSIPVNLRISVSGNQPNAQPITVHFSWIDATGTPQSSSMSSVFSKGLSLALGPGRKLSYSCSTTVAGSWTFVASPAAPGAGP